MTQPVEIRSWIEGLPSFSGTTVVFDVFRCSTTIHCLASRGPKRFLIAPNLQNLGDLREYRIYSELPAQPPCLERFDNSPHRALQHPESAPALVATTSGTPGMFAARDSAAVLVGSLVSFSALIERIRSLGGPVRLIPATLPEHRHVEDEIVAEAVRDVLENRAPEGEAVQNAISRIHESGRPEILYGKLPQGRHDVAICLDANRFSFVPAIRFEGPMGKVVW